MGCSEIKVRIFFLLCDSELKVYWPGPQVKLFDLRQKMCPVDKGYFVIVKRKIIGSRKDHSFFILLTINIYYFI